MPAMRAIAAARVGTVKDYMLHAATVVVPAAIADAEGRMVGVTGFEPATPASRTQYSTRLSYTPIQAFSRQKKHAASPRMF